MRNFKGRDVGVGAPARLAAIRQVLFTGIAADGRSSSSNSALDDGDQ